MVGAHEERVAASAGWAKMWGGRFTMYFLDKMQTCKHHFTCDWGVKLSGMGWPGIGKRAGRGPGAGVVMDFAKSPGLIC